MTYTLWLFPLLSGYYLLNNFSYSRHKYERLDKDRLIFHSVICGVFVFITLYVFRIVLNHNFPTVIPFLYKTLYNLPILKIDYFWTCIIGLLSTVGFTHLSNYSLFKINYLCFRKPIERAIDNHGDDIEKLLKDSLLNGLLLQVTLKNNKVYIGYVESIKPPSEDKFIKIVPVISGYRKSENKKLKLTTDYFDAFDLYSNTPSKFNSFSMEVILNKSEVVSANVFDLEIYEAFN